MKLVNIPALTKFVKIIELFRSKFDQVSYLEGQISMSRFTDHISKGPISRVKFHQSIIFCSIKLIKKWLYANVPCI